jgi:hypothetical protein
MTDTQDTKLFGACLSCGQFKQRGNMRLAEVGVPFLVLRNVGLDDPHRDAFNRFR